MKYSQLKYVIEKNSDLRGGSNDESPQKNSAIHHNMDYENLKVKNTKLVNFYEKNFTELNANLFPIPVIRENSINSEIDKENDIIINSNIVFNSCNIELMYQNLRECDGGYKSIIKNLSSKLSDNIFVKCSKPFFYFRPDFSLVFGIQLLPTTKRKYKINKFLSFNHTSNHETKYMLACLILKSGSQGGGHYISLKYYDNTYWIVDDEHDIIQFDLPDVITNKTLLLLTANVYKKKFDIDESDIDVDAFVFFPYFALWNIKSSEDNIPYIKPELTKFPNVGAIRCWFNSFCNFVSCHTSFRYYYNKLYNDPIEPIINELSINAEKNKEKIFLFNLIKCIKQIQKDEDDEDTSNEHFNEFTTYLSKINEDFNKHYTTGVEELNMETFESEFNLKQEDPSEIFDITFKDKYNDNFHEDISLKELFSEILKSNNQNPIKEYYNNDKLHSFIEINSVFQYDILLKPMCTIDKITIKSEKNKYSCWPMKDNKIFIIDQENKSKLKTYISKFIEPYNIPYKNDELDSIVSEINEILIFIKNLNNTFINNSLYLYYMNNVRNSNINTIYRDFNKIEKTLYLRDLDKENILYNKDILFTALFNLYINLKIEYDYELDIKNINNIFKIPNNIDKNLLIDIFNRFFSDYNNLTIENLPDDMITDEDFLKKLNLEKINNQTNNVKRTFQYPKKYSLFVEDDYLQQQYYKLLNKNKKNNIYYYEKYNNEKLEQYDILIFNFKINETITSINFINIFNKLKQKCIIIFYSGIDYVSEAVFLEKLLKELNFGNEHGNKQNYIKSGHTVSYKNITNDEITTELDYTFQTFNALINFIHIINENKTDINDEYKDIFYYTESDLEDTLNQIQNWKNRTYNQTDNLIYILFIILGYDIESYTLDKTLDYFDKEDKTLAFQKIKNIPTPSLTVTPQ